MIRRLALALVFAAGAAVGGEPGDLVFSDRAPWNGEKQSASWTINAVGPMSENFRPIKDGKVTLAEVTDAKDGKPMMHVVEDVGGQVRKIGPFPLDTPDPTLVFFLENVARDMAGITGGSPFYIRNRIKEALFQEGEVTKDGDKTIAVFRPFTDDPNKDRMGKFSALEIRFEMTDPKLPIESMTASTGGETPEFLVSMVQP